MKPSRPGSSLGSTLVWLMKLGASIFSTASTSPMTRASKKRRTRALYLSSTSDTGVSSLPTSVLSCGDAMYDATQRPQAHQLETYSSKWGAFSPTLLAPHPHASGEGEAFRGWPRWSSNAGSSRLGTSLRSVWGRIVPDIPDFCCELVAAPADGQGSPWTKKRVATRSGLQGGTR